ncbi:hypothetical protein [Aurantibacter sp.]|uniref:hypothetical protein n=1 Tax=Aurantibacter sp. TaxID=2807103 RepID=UPI0035C7E31C
MKKLLLLSLFIVLSACNTSKQIEKQLTYGNYDKAINDAIRKLSSNKERKSKQEYIGLLKRAYNKAVDRDLNDINYLKKDNNPEKYEQIYNKYINLRNRQERVKPVLPLYLNGSEVRLKFTNYASDIVNYKNKTSDYLYSKASSLLNSNNKFDARQSYQDFQYIDKINPNFRDVRSKINTALNKGRDYVSLDLKNETQQIIPKRLEQDLLNISTYGLDNLWTVYHNNKLPNVDYDFNMSLIFKNIIISPEQVKEREIIKEKLVKDGWKYVLDEEGNVKKDSLGNDIKEDKFTKVRCEYYETRQFKTSTVLADAEFKDLKTNQLLDRFPIESTFLFEHFYATSRGDNRALDGGLLDYLNNIRVQFPSNEQMIFDTGEDLKAKLKSIISGQNFR